jgi:hypothetical protein
LLPLLTVGFTRQCAFLSSDSGEHSREKKDLEVIVLLHKKRRVFTFLETLVQDLDQKNSIYVVSSNF